MAQPPAYARAFSFTDYTANHPSDQQPGVRLDTEYDAIQTTLDAVRTNLALVQRDDGVLANGSVGPDQLSTELTFGLRSVTDWVTGHLYAPNDAVWITGPKLYRCAVGHTAAAAFATDLAASRWVLVTDISAYVEPAATAAAQAAVTAEVLAGISLDVDLGPINTALAGKASLADANVFAGTNTFGGTTSFSAAVSFLSAVSFAAAAPVAIAAATSAQDYAIWKPTDYAAGKPGLFVRKKAGATAWALEVDDGAGGTGSLNLPTATTIGGVAPALQADLTALTTSVRRARNLALNAR